MTPAGPLLLLAALAAAPPLPAETELQLAVACYHELDFACAEEKLMLARRAELSREAALVALRYDALLGLAFQDEARARRAVRNLLALEPAWDPGPAAPPRLAALVAEARPRPPALLVPCAGLSGAATLLAGRDAEQWEDGLGAALAAGVLLRGSTRLELALGHGRHGARSFYLEELSLTTAVLGASQRLLGRNPQLSAGGGLGAVYIDKAGVTGETSRWGLVGQLTVEAAVRLGLGFGLRAQALPTLLAVEDDGRTAYSYLLTIQLGLAWCPE